MLPVTSSKTMLDHEIKPRKRVAFQEEVSFAEPLVLQEESSKKLWYSGFDLKLEKQTAKALAEHLSQTHPVLAQEIQEAYDFTRDQKFTGAENLLTNWYELGSGRRGLERFVLDQETRIAQAQNTKATRSVVFNLQCLFKRASNGSPLTVQQAEIIGQQYFELTRSAQNLARIYASKDEAVVQPYYAGQDAAEDELQLEDLLLDDSLMSVGSGSVSSRSSKSAKKMKKRSSSDKTSKKSSNKKSLSDSPVRRVRRPAPKKEDTAPRAA